jgi:hypothetical protein
MLKKPLLKVALDIQSKLMKAESWMLLAVTRFGDYIDTAYIR